MVHQDRALLHAGERAVVAIGHRAHVVVVADAHQHEIACPGRPRAASRRDLPPYSLTHWLRLRRGAVVDRHVVAALLQQVARHRIAHHPEPDAENVLYIVYAAKLGVKTEDLLIFAAESASRRWKLLNRWSALTLLT